MTEYVWVLTAGPDYECFELLKVFTSREKANRYMETAKEYGWWRVTRRKLI